MRVWPVAADAQSLNGSQVCADSDLAVHSAVGMGAADWFNLDPGAYPCRRWKTYAVEPGKEVRISASREDREAAPTLVRVLEPHGSAAWGERATYLLPKGSWGSGEERVFTPETGQIRIDVAPGSKSSLTVCQRGP